MRKYKAIFFDWDGTAVTSRKAPADKAARAMEPLLAAGVKLAVISGTSIENIDGGRLAERFAPEYRANLYLGLDRGANNYGYNARGELALLESIRPDIDGLLGLHRACFAFHEELLRNYGLTTDIVFSRDNYCKIDIASGFSREENLYFTGNELAFVNNRLAEHGYDGGVRGLMALAVAMGKKQGLSLKSTTDVKYIELGFSTKSDSVDTILSLLNAGGCPVGYCCFWGDEYLAMDEGIYGSDSYMITDKTRGCDFFDVSDVPGERPNEVVRVGGGVERFLAFLREQQAKGE